jgi:hypothetical protein
MNTLMINRLLEQTKTTFVVVLTTLAFVTIVTTTVKADVLNNNSNTNSSSSSNTEPTVKTAEQMFQEQKQEEEKTQTSTPRNDSSTSLIFKTPEALKTPDTKLEYQAVLDLNNSQDWKIMNKVDNGFTSYKVAKDDQNLLNILLTNQKPKNTINVVYDFLKVTKINDQFSRVEFSDSQSTNRNITYLPNTYIKTSFEVNKDMIDGKVVEKNGSTDEQKKLEEKTYPFAIIHQLNDDGTYTLPSLISINGSVNNDEDLAKADQVVANSKFDNLDINLPTPTPRSKLISATSDNSNNKGFNILPWIIGLVLFGLINYIIWILFGTKKVVAK